MKFNTKRSLSIGETPNDFTCLCVPKLNYFIEASTEKLFTIICKLNISYCFSVPHVSSQAFSMGKNVPNFDSSIMTSTKKQMTKLREELNTLYSFIMPIPGV